MEYRRKPLRRVARADEHVGVDVVHCGRVRPAACGACSSCTLAHLVCSVGAIVRLVRELVEHLVVHVR